MKAVKKFLMSFIKLGYVYLKFNEPMKVAHLEILANQSMLNNAHRNQAWKFGKFTETIHHYCVCTEFSFPSADIG